MTRRGPGVPATTRRLVTSTMIAVVLALVALLAALVGAAPAAGAAAPGACPDRNGVTVVVDFGALGGGVQVRCAPSGQPNGFAALAAVGFTVTRASTSPLFLCRIDQLPDDDPCINPSPAEAYWSYWLAEPGGRWRYSDVGAGVDGTADAGTVQGWRFTDENRQQPSIDPPNPAPPATAPAAAPPAAPAAAPPGATGKAPARGGTASPAPSRGGGAPAPTTPPAAVQGATTTPGSTAAPDPGLTSTTTAAPATTTSPPLAGERSDSGRGGSSSGDRGEMARAGETFRAATADEGSGPPTGLLVGGAAAVGLGIAAAFVTRIRRIG